MAAEAGIRRSDGGLLADGLRFFTAFRMTFALSCSRTRASRWRGKWVSVCSGTTFSMAAEAGIRRSDGGLLVDGLRFLTAFGMTLALSCSRTRASRWGGEKWVSVCSGTTFSMAAEAGIRRSDGGLLVDGLRFLTAFGMTLALSCSRTRASRGERGSGFPSPYRSTGQAARERRLPLMRKQAFGGGVGSHLYGRDRGKMGT